VCTHFSSSSITLPNTSSEVTTAGDGSFVILLVSVAVSVTSVTVMVVVSWGLLPAEGGGVGLEGGGSGLLGIMEESPPILDVELRGLRTNAD